MKRLARESGSFKSHGRRVLAFMLAVATFLTSININWSNLVVAEAWTADPTSIILPSSTTDTDYQTAIDLTSDGSTFSAGETGQLGAIITPSGSSTYEYPKAVSFCVDVVAGTSFSASAVAYQNISNPTTVSTPAEIASNGIKCGSLSSQTYSNTSSSTETIVCTLYLGDSAVRASSAASETYGVVVNITGTGQLKYYTGTNGNSGNKYVASNGDSSRALVVTTESTDTDFSSYTLVTTSWDDTKYMGVGDSTTFTAAVSEGYKRTITYSISDTSIASIDASTGVIVANATGEATVTATTASGITLTRSIAVFNSVFTDTYTSTTDDRTYPNTSDTPAVTVETASGTYSDTGFTITYPDDTSTVGTKTITIDGGSTYSGFSQTLTYNVVAQELPDVSTLETYRDNGDIIIDVGTNEVQSSTAIYASDGTTLLTLGTDYTATASNKVTSSDGSTVTYTVTFTGINNYTGTREVTEVSALNATTSNPLDISSLSAWVDDSSFIYKNAAFTTTSSGDILSNLYFTDSNGEPVAVDTSYITVSSIKKDGSTATQIKNAGSYVITITGSSIYTGSISDIDFTVAKRPLSTSSSDGFTMDPSADDSVEVLHESDTTTITPTLVYNNGTEDYELTTTNGDIEYSYTGESSIGTATVTITACDDSNFSGYIQKTYEVVPNVSLASDIEIKINGKTAAYDSSSDTYYTVAYTPTYSGKTFVGTVSDSSTQTAPTIVVKNKVTGKTLTKGTDYTVSVSDDYDNTNAGTGSFTFTLAGGPYTNSDGDSVYNTADVHFTIKQRDMSTGWFDLSSVGNLYYTGDAITLSSDQYSVYYNGSTVLTNGTDYTITGYDDENGNGSAIDAGTAKIYATGTGNYSGSIVGYFTINPRSISATDDDGNTVSPHTSKQSTSNYGVTAVMNPDKADSGELSKNYLDGDEVTLNYYNDTTNTDYDYSLNYAGYSGTTADYTVNRLSIGTDFTASYSNNRKVASWTDSAAPTVTLTGTGNYTGTRTMTFTIAPASLYTLGLNVNSVAIVNPSQYVPYASTGTTDETTGSSVAMEYDGAKPTPSVEFTEKTLTEGTSGDYIRYYFDDYDDAVSAATSGTVSDPSNSWTKDVNATDDGYGYKYLLILGVNNYDGDYKIIQFRYLPRNIALPSIETTVTSPTDASEDPEVTMYDTGLSVASLRTTALTEDTDFQLMMYDSTGALVDFEPDTTPGSSKEIIIQGIGNYTNTRSIYYKAGINLSSFTATADTTNNYLDLVDNTGGGDPEHYIKVKNPISSSTVTPNTSGDSAYSVTYLGQETSPIIQLWRVKQGTEASDTEIFGATADTSGGIEDTYTEDEITVTFEAQGDANGYDAGSIVLVTVAASSDATTYYGQTTFYYDITQADLSDVVFYDETSLDYTQTDQTTQTYPVYAYNGGKVPVSIKAKYGDEDLDVASVTTHTITGSSTAYEEGDELTNKVDTGIIDKSIYFNESSGYVVVDSTDDDVRKNYTIGHTGTSNSYCLTITVDDDNFDSSAEASLPYIIRGIDFADETGTVAAYGIDYARVVLEKDDEYYTADQTVDYDGSAFDDYTPIVQVQFNGTWYDLNEDTYTCEWVQWSDSTTKPETSADAVTPTDVGIYSVKIRPYANTTTAISELGRTAGRYVTESPMLTIGPRVTSTDLTATLSDTTFTYDSTLKTPTITITDNMGTEDDTTDDVTLVSGTDYNVLGYNYNTTTLTDDGARFPGSYTPVVEFINNYEGSSVTVPSFTISGTFTDASGSSNTYTDVDDTLDTALYYAAIYDGTTTAVKDYADNGATVLYLKDDKLYFDEDCTTQFTTSSVKMYYQDPTTGAAAGTAYSEADDDGLIDSSNYTVTISDGMYTPGKYTGSDSTDGYVTITGKSSSLFAGSSVTLTGFTVKGDLSEAVVLDDSGDDMDGIVYDWVSDSTTTILSKVTTVTWDSNTLTNGTDYTIADDDNGTLGTPTTESGTITLTAKGSSIYFGTKEITYDVKLKLYGYNVWFSNDASTSISTGSYSVDYDDIMGWSTTTQPLAYMTTEDSSGNTIQVDPSYYTVTITKSTTSYTSESNSGTVSKFTDGTNTILATDFTPGTYQISFIGKNGAELDTSITSATPSFTVNAMALSGYTYDSSITYTYDGGAHTPDTDDSSFAVYDKYSNVLTKNTDYTVSYANNVNAAKSTATSAPTLTITGMGNYTGTLTYAFTIEPKSISTATVEIPDQYYTGEAITPISQTVVMDGSTTLTRNTDYTLTTDDFSNNIEVGSDSATATITGTGNYTGYVTGTFSILALDFTKVGLTFEGNECEYTGKRLYPEVPSTTPSGAYKTIKPTVANMENDGVFKVLIPNTEDSSTTVMSPSKYTVTFDSGDTYETDANENGYDIVITSNDSNYTGSITTKYYVHQKSIAATDWATDWVDAENTTSLSNVSQYDGTYNYKYTLGIYNSDGDATLDYDYNNGSAVEPTVCITDSTWWTGTSSSVSDNALTQDTDFTVSYENNTVGASKDSTAAPTITITGAGNYTGTLTKTFNIGVDLTEEYNSAPRFTVSSLEEFEYNGSEQLPDAITVYDNEKGIYLTQDTCYTFDASTDKINAGMQELVVTGANNYYGTIEYDADDQPNAYYTINPMEVDPDGTWSITLNTTGSDVTDTVTSKTYQTETYCGSALKPGMTITYTDDDGNTYTLAETDYTINYTDNTDANMVVAGSGYTRKSPSTTYPLATAQAVLSESGNYQFTDYTSGDTQSLDSKYFAILPYDISTDGTLSITDSDASLFPDLTVDDSYAILAFDSTDHSAITPAIKVTFSGTDAPDDITASASTDDVTLSYSDNYDPGLATVVVSGTGNFCGELSTYYHIVANIEDATITLDSDTIKPYTDGTVGYPKVSVKYVFSDDTYLTVSESTDYTISALKDGVLATKGDGSTDDVWTTEGDATLYITGVEPHFTGVQTVAYTYDEDGDDPDDGNPDFDEDSIVVDTSTTTFTYDTNAHYPAVTTVYDTDGNLLTEGTDYEVTYSTSSGDATSVGTSTTVATITGLGDYENADAVSVSTDITITAKSIADSDVTYNTSSFVDVTYTGSAITPTTTVRYNGTTLTQNTDYTITYINNVDPGVACVRITGINNYTDSKADIFFTINTVDVAGLKVSSTSSSSVTLTWTKSSYAAGYMISYTLGGRAKSVTTTSNSVTISGLSSSTTYSFAVRSYVKSTSTSRIYYGDPTRVTATTK